MSEVRIGVIGAGRMAEFHNLGYQDKENCNLWAVCDVDEAVVDRRRQEWGATRGYTDYHELLADPDVDAVDIITPHNLHAPMTIAALEAGKHVSVQKPMCLTVADADAMIAAAKRSGKMLRVFENFHYYPPFLRAKELLDSGAIGEPMSMRMKMARDLRPEPEHMRPSAWAADLEQHGDGEVVFDYGSHLWPVAMRFLGDIEKVFGWHGEPQKSRWGPLDNPAIVVWKYVAGDLFGSCDMVATDEIHIATKYFPEDEWFEVTGSAGFIWVNRCSGMLLDRPPIVMYRDGVTTEFSDVDSDWASSFVLAVADFVDAILEGRQAEQTPESGKRTIQMGRAIQRSAKEGREVRLDEMV